MFVKSLLPFLAVLPVCAQQPILKPFADIAHDQKQIWTAPAHIPAKRQLVAAGVVIATTGVLTAFDPVINRHFRTSNTLAPFNRALSSNITGYGTFATPAALFAAGLIRHDEKMRSTALAAGEALVDAEIVATVTKRVTGGSFPSGHAASAFAVATVISRRYSNHRWVPWVAYGLAGAVSASRVTSSAHSVSDVFFGSALGYSIGRFKTPGRKAYAADSESLPSVP